MHWIVAAAFMMVFFAFLVVPMILSQYVRCPPNKAVVRWGAGEEATVFRAGGAYVLPFVQSHGFLDLAPQEVDFETGPIPTRDGGEVRLSGTLRASIGSEESALDKAARRLLATSQRNSKKRVTEQLRESAIRESRRLALEWDADAWTTPETDLRTLWGQRLEEELAEMGVEVSRYAIAVVDDDLSRVVASWPRLSAEVRVQILALAAGKSVSRSTTPNVGETMGPS